MYARFVAHVPGVVDSYAANEPASVLRAVMALADEANRYIDEQKPWVIAKQADADDALQGVCTQGINLFRVLMAMLKPILPRVAAEAEVFLNAPFSRWSELDDPLLDHRIHPYAALFTRIDTSQVQAMIDASRDSLHPADATTATPVAAKAQRAAQSPAQSVGHAPASGATATVGIDDFAKLDLRIGKVLACEAVDGSDKLLRFELDAGDLGKRQIFSGIRSSYADPQSLVGRNVVFIANLAPRKMRFGISEGMILSAGADGGRLHLLDVDDGAAPGLPVK
jgi:methionyl-tRNA synthetase